MLCAVFECYFYCMSLKVRCIIDLCRSARFNMAADLFLMEQCSEASTVTLRFYTWKPAAITLGRMQRATQQLDVAALVRDGIEWIRRPTGGRAVLHCEDLTYSCVFPRRYTRLGTSVATTYATITRCLAAGLGYAGVRTAAQDSASTLIKSGRAVKLPCFLAPNRNEIMVNSRKLIGSAQYRSGLAVLQHGSLPLTPAYRRLPHYMPLTPQERLDQEALLKEKSVSLGEICPAIAVEELIGLLARGFAEVTAMPCVESVWDERETAAIEQTAQSGRFKELWLGDGDVPVP